MFLPINLRLLSRILLQYLVNGRSSLQSLHPTLHVRKVLCKIQPMRLHSGILPGDESKVSVCTLVSHEILATLEIGLSDLRDAADLVNVAVNGTLHFLGVGKLEPLSDISCRALTKID